MVIRDLPALGVKAQGLNYLNFLIAELIHAAAIYRSGVQVQVPRPERYAIHKLIVADRRRDGAGSLKSAKDREQAAFLIEAMAEDRPDDLARAGGWQALARAHREFADADAGNQGHHRELGRVIVATDSRLIGTLRRPGPLYLPLVSRARSIP